MCEKKNKFKLCINTYFVQKYFRCQANVYSAHAFRIIRARLQFRCLKATANKRTLLRKQNCVQAAKNVFGKFQKHILLSRRKFCVFNICCLWAQTKNHLGNTEKTLTSNVFRLFLRLLTQATHFEDAEFAS